MSDAAPGYPGPDGSAPEGKVPTLEVTSLDIAMAAARGADEKQGRDIVVLDVGPVLHITDYFVVVDAPNRRLVRTLVDEIELAVRAMSGRSPLRTEGLKEHQWVLVDYGDVVVHVFLDEVRRFYEIERLYRDVATVDWSIGHEPNRSSS